jgi:hypothetical protein
MEKKVYITQECNVRDFTGATNFGLLKFVTKKEYTYIENTSINDRIKEDINNILSDFSKDDFLLLNGNPINIALCISYLLVRHKTINVLKFNKREKVYTKYVLNEI